MRLLIAVILLYLALCGFTRYEVPADNQVLIKSLELMLSQVGIREKTGKNDGPEIEKYLRAVGLPKGNPYCAAGQYWCYSEAVKTLNLDKSFIPILRTGLANAIFTDAVKRGKISNNNARQHDLMVWRKGKTPYGHIERIIKIGKKGWVTTVGFNTGSSNPREGNGVYVKKRNINNPLGIMVLRGIIGFNGGIDE